MRVCQVAVTGLFGLFDHTLKLSSDDRVTVIHGPNGVGKTTLLRMIASLFEGDLHAFQRIPFKEFSVSLDSNVNILLRRDTSDSPPSKPELAKLVLSLDEDGRVSENVLPPLTDLPVPLLDQLDRYVPGPFRRHHNGWQDDHGATYSVSEILSRFPAAAKALPKKYRRAAMLRKYVSVLFVDTRRLLGESARSSRPRMFRHVPYRHDINAEEDFLEVISSDRYNSPRVEQYSRDVAQRLESTLGEYATQSQKSDRTLPERLVRFLRDGDSPLPASEILDRMALLEDKRQRLISLGLLAPEHGLSGLSEDDIRRAQEALTIYVTDVEDKLRVFDALELRIGKLLDVLNDRYKFKNLRIDRQGGFRVTTTTGQRIPLEDLSSGEQHELVVLYQLLFQAPPKGLVLVDEPEISLHVAWQSRFLTDLRTYPLSLTPSSTVKK